MRAARSGTEDFTVREASGEALRDWGLDFELEALAVRGGSGAGAGVGGVGLRGSDVKASGAEMAEMTPPKAV